MAEKQKPVEPESEPVAQEDPQAGWLLVEAQENLVGGGSFVAKGERYLQPPEAAHAMAKQGWVKIVNA